MKVMLYVCLCFILVGRSTQRRRTCKRTPTTKSITTTTVSTTTTNSVTTTTVSTTTPERCEKTEGMDSVVDIPCVSPVTLNDSTNVESVTILVVDDVTRRPVKPEEVRGPQEPNGNGTIDIPDHGKIYLNVKTTEIILTVSKDNETAPASTRVAIEACFHPVTIESTTPPTMPTTTTETSTIENTTVESTTPPTMPTTTTETSTIENTTGDEVDVNNLENIGLQAVQDCKRIKKVIGPRSNLANHDEEILAAKCPAGYVGKSCQCSGPCNGAYFVAKDTCHAHIESDGQEHTEAVAECIDERCVLSRATPMAKGYVVGPTVACPGASKLQSCSVYSLFVADVQSQMKYTISGNSCSAPTGCKSCMIQVVCMVMAPTQ